MDRMKRFGSPSRHGFCDGKGRTGGSFKCWSGGRPMSPVVIPNWLMLPSSLTVRGLWNIEITRNGVFIVPNRVHCSCCTRSCASDKSGKNAHDLPKPVSSFNRQYIHYMNGHHRLNL